jgi:hypothetical protein
MRSFVRSIGIAGGILVLAGIQNASAQVTNPVEFTTSFPFTVGNSTMPAGAYTIRPDDDNPEILQLTGKQGSVLFQTNAARSVGPAPKTEVVFKRYGDAYILKTVWLSGSDEGAEALPQEGERHVAKHGGSATEQRVAAKKTSTTVAKKTSTTAANR